jgi:hypothetical protein
MPGRPVSGYFAVDQYKKRIEIKKIASIFKHMVLKMHYLLKCI